MIPTNDHPSVTPSFFIQIELEHRSSKAKYPSTNKHEPDRDIGQLHHRVEVLQSLNNGHPSHSTLSKRAHVDQDESHKMSEDSRDFICLTAFITVPRGGVPDPAKKVCYSENLPCITLSTCFQGLCEET